MSVSVEIPRRFCGPPQSGNGGYVAGRLAAYLTEAPSSVAVRLFAPPPLDVPLAVREEGERVGLFDGEIRVAEARPVAFDLDVPEAPDFDVAARSAEGFRGFEDRIFPGCFVCGCEREEGDGLRIFPGAVDGTDRFAAPWVPDASLADAGGESVAPAFLWAALDCPGAFSFPQPEGRVILLGEMQTRVDGSVRVGESCVLTSWFLGKEGRKARTASALHGADGRLVACALGLWIEIDPARVPRD